MTTPFHYTAYGLSIASQRELPELRTPAERGLSPLEAAATEPDVEVVWRDLPGSDEWLRVEGDVAHLHFARVCTFRIVGGRRIEVCPAEGVSQSSVRLPLLGAAMALVLHQRGLFTMHSSAVSVGGRAALFIGEKGQGKSTLASALYGRGHELLADDIAVITPASEGSGLVVRPGFPQFKLVPDSLKAALGMEEHELPHVGPLVDKRAHRITERFATRDVPLARVYILSIGDWELGSPSTQQTLAHVLAQSYAARFGRGLLSGASAASHLAMCARLVSSGCVRLLQRPRDLGFLGETARRIEEDIDSAAAQA